jgi:hypothetical protein
VRPLPTGCPLSPRPKEGLGGSRTNPEPQTTLLLGTLLGQLPSPITSQLPVLTSPVLVTLHPEAPHGAQPPLHPAPAPKPMNAAYLVGFMWRDPTSPYSDLGRPLGHVCPGSCVPGVTCALGHVCPGSCVPWVMCALGHVCPGSCVPWVTCALGWPAEAEVGHVHPPI